MRRFLVLPLLALVPVQAAHAGLDPYGTSARASGLSETFVAVADDLGALYHNPAGLGEAARPSLSAKYGSLLSDANGSGGVTSSDLSGALPLNGGRSGTVALGAHRFQGSRLFTEQSVRFAYGVALPSFEGGERASLGVALTHFSRAFSRGVFAANAIDGNGAATGAADPLFAKGGFSASAYAADLGFLCRFGNDGRYGFGASVANLNRPDLSLRKNGDRAPRLFRAGIARHRGRSLVTGELRRRTIGTGRTDTDFAVGGETWIRSAGDGRLGFRGGYEQGSRDHRSLAGGLSAALRSVQLDYAFVLPVGAFADAGVSHHLTVGWTIGTTPAPESGSHTSRKPIPDASAPR